MEYNCPSGDFVHKCMEAIGFGKFHVLMLMVLGLRCFVRGSLKGMLSILQPYLRCHMKLSIFAASWLVTVLSIGRLLGAILIGRMADKFGRQRTMLCLFSSHMVLSLLNSLSSSFAMTLITRASIGLVFEAGILVYTYGMESLPITKRNYLAVIDGFYGLGSLFAIFSAMDMLEAVNWRWYVVVTETIPIAICSLLAAILPESPRYLFSQGHIQEAVNSLEKIAAINGADCHKVVYDSGLSLEDGASLYTHPKKKYSQADGPERAKSDSFVTEAAPCSKLENEGRSSTSKEKYVHHQASLGNEDQSSADTLLPKSNGRSDEKPRASMGAKPEKSSKADLPKSELYKRVIILACLRFAVQGGSGIFALGSMQFKNPSSKIACGSCSANMNYNFVITYALASETGFLLSFFLTGKYNRRFALAVVFSCRALLVIPFYFGLNQWIEVPLFFIAGVSQFCSFIIANIYASEVIPTSHRALAGGIENTAGNLGLLLGNFFALYVIHTNYYAVLAALQGLTIVIIIIILLFVIDSKNVPLSDS